MSQTVMIKSNKYGINLILNPDVSFRELLTAIIEKFKESEKFFHNSKLAIAFEGRRLSQEEEYRIIDAITENTSIEIVCILDNDAEKEARMKQQIDEYCNAVESQYAASMAGQGDFYKGTLRSGQLLESDSSITIIGDVNPGAKIVSGGNIVILGALKGNAHAGAYGNEECFIFALDMNPIQIQIGSLIAKSPDKQKTRRSLLKKDKDASTELQIAIARDGAIYMEPVTKKILNNI